MLLFIHIYRHIIIYYTLFDYVILCSVYMVIDTTLMDIIDYILLVRLYDMQYYVILYAILSNVVFNTTLCGFMCYVAMVNVIYYATPKR